MVDAHYHDEDDLGECILKLTNDDAAAELAMALPQLDYLLLARKGSRILNICYFHAHLRGLSSQPIVWPPIAKRRGESGREWEAASSQKGNSIKRVR